MNRECSACRISNATVKACNCGTGHLWCDRCMVIHDFGVNLVSDEMAYAANVAHTMIVQGRAVAGYASLATVADLALEPEMAKLFLERALENLAPAKPKAESFESGTEVPLIFYQAFGDAKGEDADNNTLKFF